MATWEDGPEYAPVERPAEFAEPSAPPLSIAEPVEQMAALAPKNRPAFDEPPVPVAPLATLIPPPGEHRDPQQPFAVVASAMTSDSAWGAVHWGRPGGPPASVPLGPFPSSPIPAAPTGGPWGAPSLARRPAAEQPFPPPSSGGPAAPPNGFPAPGTPAWFGPGPYPGQPSTPDRVSARSVFDAATPGLCICLALGGFIYVLAPVMLAVAFSLTSRVMAARTEVRRAFGIGTAVWLLIAMMAGLTNDEGFSGWWTTVGAWAVVVCWGLLLTTLVLVYRELKAGGRPALPTRSPWG
jgi:hypothetical protein